MSLPRYRDPLEAAGPDTSDEVLRNKLRSNNWDGAGSLPTVDSAATEGYLLDPASGIAQFTTMYVGGNTAPRGLVGQAKKTTNQSGISGETDVSGLSVALTTVAGRVYKLTALVRATQGSPASPVVCRITNGSNTSLGATVFTTTAGWTLTHNVLTYDVPGAGSTTYKVRMATSFGTVQVDASATAPAVLMVEDVGA